MHARGPGMRSMHVFIHFQSEKIPELNWLHTSIEYTLLYSTLLYSTLLYLLFSTLPHNASLHEIGGPSSIDGDSLTTPK